jgi:glycosyltransferase involved in cell wall biosynthesis
MVLEPAPNYGGGCEQVSLSLSQFLAKREHQIFLLHEAEGTMLSAYDSIVSRRFSASLPGFSRRRPYATLTSILQIGRLIREHQIEVLFSSHLGFIPVGAGLFSIFGTPTCFHLGLPNSPNGARATFAYPRISAGVCPSSHCADSWRQGGWPADRLHTISNWVDSIRFAPATDVSQVRRELGLPLDGAIVLFVGRICREKGVEHLIESFRALDVKGLNAYLVFVGHMDPHYTKNFDGCLARFNASDRERVLVRASTTAPEKYFAAATLACLPPIWEEPFGLTLIEAMSSGVPIVATRVKAFEQIMGDGLSDTLVPPGDVKALTGKIDWWRRNPEARAVFGRKLREMCLAKYSSSACGSQYESLLRSIVRERHAG